MKKYWLLGLGLLIMTTLVISGCASGEAVATRCNGRVISLEKGDILNSAGYKFEYLYQAYAQGLNALLVDEKTLIPDLGQDVVGKSYTYAQGKTLSVLKNQDFAGGELVLCLKK